MFVLIKKTQFIIDVQKDLEYAKNVKIHYKGYVKQININEQQIITLQASIREYNTRVTDLECETNSLKDRLTKKDDEILMIQKEKISSIEKMNTYYNETIEVLKQKERLMTEVIIIIIIIIIIITYDLFH